MRGLKTAAIGGVALTFDDGPHPDVTPRILELLAGEGACGTFFLVGDAVAAHPDLALAIARAGHGVGNHTQSHANLLLCTPWRVRREIERCQKSIESAAGVSPRVFRAPWGKLTATASRTCGRLGLVAYDWTVAPEGWPDALDVDAMVELALACVRPGAIIDLHDVPWHNDAGRRSLAALPRIIEGLRAGGLETMLLPEVAA